MNKRICTVPDCGKALAAKGWCAMHYRRIRVHGSLELPERPQPICSVEGCETGVKSRGWCLKHYKRWRATGTPHGIRTGQCAECGGLAKAGKRGAIPKVCDRCKSVRCRTCDGPVSTVWRGGPKAGFYPASYYCSDDCKPRCPIEGCDRPVRKRGWCNNHYATWRDHGAPDAPVKYTWAERSACLVCGNADFTTWTVQRRELCSANCQRTWWKYSGNVPKGFHCAVCAAFVPYFDPLTRKRLRSDAAYCTQHIRHARLYVTVEQIAAEDGADCRLCGEPVDMSIPGPDRRAPSIDHIVPRALGGSDYRENLQLAHKGCNSSKRHHYAG